MRWILFLMVAVLGPALAGHDKAGASEWGCEVLLCAASDNPSWHSVASCRSPMERLIRAMKRPGFSWPTCTEGGAGKPGYERYAECPAGWSPAHGVDDGNGLRSSEMSRCSRMVSQCGTGRRNRIVSAPGLESHITRRYLDDGSCSYTEFMARPLRDKPYYFDIHDDKANETKRYFFDLRK